MAIAGFSVNTGAKGRAVAHAAYVARTGAYARYTEQGEMLEANEWGNMPAWAEHDPSRFWRAADAHERANGTSYREFLISLPRELSPDERRELVKSFVAEELGDVHAYQYAIHVPRASDGLDNPHVHLMFSERRADRIDRDPDQYFRRFNAAHPERGGAQKGYGQNPGMKLTAVERKDELKALRERWEVCVNTALERAGHSVRVNMKSYADRGLDIVPEPKQLPSAWRSEGKKTVLEFRTARAAELEVRRDPGVIIDRVSSMKALFTRQDLYRELNRVTDDVAVFNEVKAQLDVHPLLVPLETGRVSGSSKELLTTREVLETEASIRALGDVLVEPASFGLSGVAVKRALSRDARLSDEQIDAVRHVTGKERLALVAGVAGAGKSTMLSVVRDGYEAAGYRVSGMALAGKAADELTRSSGIESRTLASWLYRYSAGMLELGSKDVLVLDEAGMVHNGTMDRVLNAANRAGAKVILVGDAEQLQPIEAGCPFRSLSDDHGVARIDTVRRQSAEWQREATQALSRGEGRVALFAYTKRGHVHHGEQEVLVPRLVENYLSGEVETAVILAHRKVDVAMLNAAVRSERDARGDIGEARVMVGGTELAVEDRVVFTKNDRRLGVLNGQFGVVTRLAGKNVRVKLDEGPTVTFSGAEYTHVQHGYASTIHKAQGMTVDRALLWGSASLDRHLGYVGMSRHRAKLDVYQPAEATRLRTLETCLSRTTRAVTVEATMEQHGLGVDVGEDGRMRLSRQYPTVVEVEETRELTARATARIYKAFEAEQQQREQALEAAKKALVAHQAVEPAGQLKVLLFSQDAVDARNDWENREWALERAVKTESTALEDWNAMSSRSDFRNQLVGKEVARLSVDPLSPAGGVERDKDGRIRITNRYPLVARSEVQGLLAKARQETRTIIAKRDQNVKQEVDAAVRDLDFHRRHEPTDSKWQVFMYQGPKQARDAWDAKLPKLESILAKAQKKLSQWEHGLKHEQVFARTLWERFAQKAPDALKINAMTSHANEQRAERVGLLRQYHRSEKALESGLGRSVKKDHRQARDQLVQQFARDQHRERLPTKLQAQIVKYKQVQEKERELSRSRSQGRGLGR